VGKEYFRMAVDFMNSEKISVFNWKEEKESSIKNYTTSDFGIALLIAKRCIREQIPFIQVSLSGWDTHNNNKERIQKLANEVDLPLYHFVNELKSEGLWQQTLIYLNTEFGRKPEIAPNGDGRDHHPKVWSCLLGGGKIPENHVVGESDKEGKYPSKNQCLSMIYWQRFILMLGLILILNCIPLIKDLISLSKTVNPFYDAFITEGSKL